MNATSSPLLFSYRVIFRAAPLAGMALILCTILIGFMPGIQAFMLTSLMEQLSDPAPPTSWGGVPLAFIGITVVSVVQMLCSLGNNLAFQYAKNRMNTRCTELILQKVPRLAAESFEIDGVHDQLYRAYSNREAPFEQIRAFHSVGSIFISLISFLVYVQSLNMWLSVVFALSIVLYSVQMFFQSKVEHRVYEEQTAQERELNHLAEIGTRKNFGKEVRLFGLAGYVFDTWLSLSERLTKQVLRVRTKHHLQNLFLTTAGFATVTIFFVIVALSVGSGQTSTAAFAGLVSFIGQLGYMISNVGKQTRDFNLTRLKVRNVIEFLQVQEDAVPEAQQQLFDVQGTLHVKNVSFRYPGSETWTLQDINLEINPGETIGIVGENGAGKTTLACLLAGLYKPIDGEILLDHVPLRELSAEFRTQQIGFVHQKPIRYELSFRENIELAATAERGALEDVVEAFHMHDLLQKMPEGFETLLGRSFGTLDLSGGEWQRMAIARCVVRNPAVYILDEPTSALDPENESMIFNLFHQLSAQKTTVIISHRLGSIKGVDKIVVLNRGRIVEVGRHEDLIARGGEYCRLYELQAQWYKEGEWCEA
ncbi:ABC transporter ATP-binding protein [Tumebacillus sp. ITR2]|uniref:ABC transporter ATP-binding protein n=1 Tax=Tumebacillus amylolyticus TaxID=2801339 RepID=A0ABS1JBW3_9BACL|nr:ABC transporter ATP-binding protein [Tumebacillus amylolyticus]MBL0387695.1 ABC transporter ATP-binding protein [Tumebacillus amylolyticus]